MILKQSFFLLENLINKILSTSPGTGLNNNKFLRNYYDTSRIIFFRVQ